MRVIQILTSVAFAALLCACGGGDEIPAKATTVSTVITVTPPVLIAAARGGVPVHFGGGACGGGNGQLTATWSYGDGSSSDSGSTHTYPVAATTQSYSLIVKCTDTANNPWATITAIIQVAP